MNNSERALVEKPNAAPISEEIPGSAFSKAMQGKTLQQKVIGRIVLGGVYKIVDKK